MRPEKSEIGLKSALQEPSSGGWKVTQRSKAPAAYTEDTGSVPGTHMGAPNNHNSSVEGSYTLF